MEVFEAVRTVLAIRNYKETAVPPEVVRRIVEAGRLTGSAMNTQPWHFIVVDEKDTLNELGAIARTGPYVAQAPLAIVVAIQKTKFSEYAKSDRFQQAATVTTVARHFGAGPGVFAKDTAIFLAFGYRTGSEQRYALESLDHAS